MTTNEKLVKIFSVHYHAFLNELVRLFPYKIEIRLLTSYVATFTHGYLLEEGSKLLNDQLESSISNRDVEGLVCLVPNNHKSTVRSLVNELTNKNLKILRDWADLFIKILKKYNIYKIKS